jgi:hypothetical protein
MQKKYLIAIIVMLVVAGLAYFGLSAKKDAPPNNTAGQCAIKEVTFYYLEGCEWCNKVKDEGTIEKIEALNIKVNKINAAIGPVRHQFSGVPTFIIDGKVYEGYRTFEEIKELLKCSLEENQPDNAQVSPSPLDNILSEVKFIGEKGTKVEIDGEGEIKLDKTIFTDNQAKFYNVKMATGKTIYFFVVKDKNGVYRAAANGCQVCFGTGKGFRQEGDEIVCNNCGNRYPVEKIATEKGGCNPGPIDPNIEIINGKLIIKGSSIEEVANLF